MSTIRDKVRHELRELVPATVYLVVTFNIIGFTKYLLLRDYGINVSTFASSTILALLAAKAMVVADTLPFMEPFRPRPITYNVLWKTSAYVAAIFAVQLLEDVALHDRVERLVVRRWRPARLFRGASCGAERADREQQPEKNPLHRDHRLSHVLSAASPAVNSSSVCARRTIA